MTNEQQDTAPEIFDSRGKLRPRDSYSESELAGMSPNRRKVFDELYAAFAEEAEREQYVKDCLAEIKKAAAVVELKRVALWKFKPKLTFHDIWKRDVVGIEPNVPDGPEVKVAERELIDAESHLDICQQEEQAARAAVTPARRRVGQALAAYTATFPVMNEIDGIKQYLASETQRRRDVAEGKIAPTRARRPASVLDAHLSGYRGDPAQRPNQARRGAHTRDKFGATVKPPSER